MSLRPITACLLGLVFLAPPVWASEEIGLELLDTCRSEQQALRGVPTRSVRYGLCLGYLKGVADSLNGRGFCIPDQETGTLTQALKRAFLRYASENPEKLALPARYTVLPAFQRAFPCLQGRPSP